jgi:hypothetical protein
MQRLLTFTLLFIMLVLTGCQTNTTRSPWASRGTIPSGSTIHLLQPLTVPARDNQVFIQNGEAAYSKGITYGYDQYYPFCYFELHGLAEGPRTIEKDTFVIQRVYVDETEFVRSKPVKVASLVQVASSDDPGGGIRLIVQTTVMELHSDNQPSVRRLVCAGGFDFESFAQLPTIKDVNDVLQGIARLETAVPGPQ